MVPSRPKGWGGMVQAAAGGLAARWGGMVVLREGLGLGWWSFFAKRCGDVMADRRYHTLAGMLAASPPRVRLLGCSLPNDAEHAAVRSCCEGTLASWLLQLDAAIAPHAFRMREGHLPR